MAEQDNVRVLREVFDAWNQHDANRLMKLVDEKFIGETDTLPAPIVGREAAGQMMQMYVRAFPDLRLIVDQMIASGDNVVTRWTATGTHRGELMGIAATNRSVTTHGCLVSELRGERIVRDWSYWDTGYLLRQLGVLATPGK